MQVNPKIQFNGEDDSLSLESPNIESEINPVTDDIKDEAELTAIENEQKQVAKNTQENSAEVVFVTKKFKRLRKNDRLILAGSMMAGVLSLVSVYMIVIMTW